MICTGILIYRDIVIYTDIMIYTGILIYRDILIYTDIMIYTGIWSIETLWFTQTVRLPTFVCREVTAAIEKSGDRVEGRSLFDAGRERLKEDRKEKDCSSVAGDEGVTPFPWIRVQRKNNNEGCRQNGGKYEDHLKKVVDIWNWKGLLYLFADWPLQ